jgi:hypothetical protein
MSGHEFAYQTFVNARQLDSGSGQPVRKVTGATDMLLNRAGTEAVTAQIPDVRIGARSKRTFSQPLPT